MAKKENDPPSVAEVAADAAHNYIDNAQEFVDATKEKTQKFVDQGLQTVDSMNDSVVTFVKKNPYKTILVAVSAGLLVGWLVRGSGRSRDE